MFVLGLKSAFEESGYDGYHAITSIISNKSLIYTDVYLS